MAAGPSVVRYPKRRRVGERLGGRKKIIRGLVGSWPARGTKVNIGSGKHNHSQGGWNVVAPNRSCQ